MDEDQYCDRITKITLQKHIQTKKSNSSNKNRNVETISSMNENPSQCDQSVTSLFFIYRLGFLKPFSLVKLDANSYCRDSYFRAT